MTAAELRALYAQGPAVVMASRDDMLALLDRAEAWQRTAATMATAAMRGDAVAALDIWKQHIARDDSRATSSAPAERAPAASSPAVRMDDSSLNSPGAPASGAFSGEG